ncbi:MAG: DUF559 domain-containing protein [Salinibacterium sp.]|nr:DUF559 domain-containing protein [Salinibacterium sp.]
MLPVERAIRDRGLFLRRRDLLALGFTDAQLRQALDRKCVLRVRHGWYTVPDAPELGIRAVRVGGQLTALSALESYGLRVPRPAMLHVAVKPTSSRLRHPSDRRLRLSRRDGATVHWTVTLARSAWRVTVVEALLSVLRTEGRDISVAACGAALHARAISPEALDRLFDLAPVRAREWRNLISALDEAHGETFARLWLADAGIRCVQQVEVGGLRLDFQLGPHTFLEIDGSQHGEPEGWERDRDRDLVMAAWGYRTLRVTYRQLYRDWPRVLAAIERAIADDAALVAHRLRHPYRPYAGRKRRRSAAEQPS